jgi:phenylpropionate dioxygenase-like ring-hydroxylating dioxygenase large terminal subunit
MYIDTHERNIMGGHQFFTESNHSGGMFRRENDDSQTAFAQPAESKTMILTFGKHSGLTIEDVYAKHPSYCRWMYTQSTLNVSPEIREFLDTKFKPAADGSTIIHFGKYKNRSVRAINRLDPNYIEWLRRSTKDDALAKEINELLGY